MKNATKWPKPLWTTGLRLLLPIIFLLLLISQAQAITRRVSKDGTLGGNGLSWATAEISIVRTINNSTSGDTIWIAKGSYFSDGGYVMKSGVKVFGGFNGNETQLSQRNPALYPVYLKAAFSASGTPPAVTYSNVSSTTLLDGVSIYQSGGGGIYINGTANSGAISNAPTIKDVIIQECSNTYGNGGGMEIVDVNPVLINVTFKGNSAQYGGAVFIDLAAPSFTNVLFVDNTSANEGGAVLLLNNDRYNRKANFQQCVFYNNKAGGVGGAAHCNIASPVFTNCTFYKNACGSPNAGGAINTYSPYGYTPQPTSTISNCVFWGNTNNAGQSTAPVNSDIYVLRANTNATYSYFIETNSFYSLSNITSAGDPFTASANPAGADGLWRTCDDGLIPAATNTASGVVDKGSVVAVAGLATDFAGNTRRINDIGTISNGSDGAADMGAYENQRPSNLALFTGTIGNAHTIPFPQELFPDCITSLTPPGIGMAVVRWEKKEGSGTWGPAGGLSPADSIGLRLPAIVPGYFPYTVYYRRIATGTAVCNVEYATDSVAIKVVNAEGTLSGYVKSRNGTTPVQGVTVQLQRLSPPLSGGPDGMTYTTVTGNQGQYSFPAVYYGDPSVPGNVTRFRITPMKQGHIFSPAIDTLFTNNLHSYSNVNFTDSTGYAISGQTYQQCDDCGPVSNSQVQRCPLDSVDIWKAEGVQPSIKITQSGYISPSFGQYGFVAENPGNLTVEAKFANHTFSSSPRTIVLTNNVTDLDFRDVTTHTITGRLTAGCGNYIGTAVLEFTDTLPNDASNNPRASCFKKQVQTAPGSGYFSVTLPARKYEVKVISFLPEITSSSNPAYINPTDLLNFFNIKLPADSLFRDITKKDTVLNLVYQRPPVLEVSGTRISYISNATCNKPFGIWPQLAKDSFFVKVFQGPVNMGCPLFDTNQIHIFTNIQGDASNQEILAPVTDTGYWVKLRGGNPNIIAPYYKTLNVQFADRYGNKVTSVYNGTTIDGIRKDIVVTGLKQNEAAFHTVSPQVPMLILHDPPGDNSYSFWQQSQTSKTTMKTYVSTGGGGSLWAEIKVGAKFEAGLGFSTESEIWGTIENELKVDVTHKSSNQTELTTTALQNISTNASPTAIGNDGDVYMGMAMNLICAKAIEINYNANTCAVESNIRLAMANEGFSTQYVYSEAHIKNTIIPNLIRDAALLADPVKADSLRNQSNVWQTVLNNNKANRDAARFEKNVSFDGGAGPYVSSTTVTKSKSNTIEYNMVVDEELAYGMGLYVAGSGGAGKVKLRFKSEWGGDTTTTNSTETTTGYSMKDDDFGDYFTVDVKKDLVYGTPVFEMKAGVASCPNENKAQPRNEVSLAIPVPAKTGVPANSQAEFILKIRNTSQSEETRTYLLSFDQASNPDGAVVTINGSPVVAPFSYTVPYLQETQVTLRVANASSTVYSYHNLRFIVTDNCGGSARDSGLISVDFLSPCSNITLAAPVNDWVLDAGANNTLSTLLTGYNVPGLTRVTLQYAKKGVSTWSDGYTKLASDLNPNGNNGQIVDWNIGNLPDSFYNLRVQLVCGQGITVYSETRPGVIDRTAPILLGNPTPANNSYVNGDIISFSYNEKLLAGLSSVQVAMKRLSNNALIPVTVSGYENKIVITPVSPITGLVSETIQVVVNGVADQYGNLRTRPDTSYFVVGVSPVNVGNRALIVTSTNTRLYKNADTTMNVFFKLPVNATDSMRVNYTIGGTARFGIDYTVEYANAQPAYTFFNGAQGAICIRKNTASAWLKIRPVSDTSLLPDKTIIISLSEGGDYVPGSVTSVTDTLTSEDSVLYYTFTGNGNFTERSNWEYGNMPLTTLAPGKTIYINPGGVCNLNVPLTIKPGAFLIVKASKQFIVQGNLINTKTP